MPSPAAFVSLSPVDLSTTDKATIYAIFKSNGTEALFRSGNGTGDGTFTADLLGGTLTIAQRGQVGDVNSKRFTAFQVDTYYLISVVFDRSKVAGEQTSVLVNGSDDDVVGGLSSMTLPGNFNEAPVSLFLDGINASWKAFQVFPEAHTPEQVAAKIDELNAKYQVF